MKNALEKKSSYKFMRKKMTFTRKLAKLKKGKILRKNW